MLLLTDRVNESHRVQRVLGQVQSCSVVPLHHASTHPATGSMIVCDVALDNIASFELLRAALAHHRTVASIPVLCLARDPSHLTLSQAKSIDATAVLPSHAPPAQLLDAVKQLLKAERAQAGPARSASRDVDASAREVAVVLSDLFGAAQSRRPISMGTLDRGADIVLAAIGRARIRAWLDVVWNHDDATYQHCLLVAGLAAAFGLRLGLTVKSQRLLSQAALIHDIGKAHIPTDILNKPGRLSSAETAVMRKHVTIGHQLLTRQRGLDPLMLDVVLHHHEYLDGSGYPDGLAGQAISQIVRVVTIADIYAALIERRPYKTPMPPEKALAALLEMAPKLDGGLLDIFCALIREA